MTFSAFFVQQGVGAEVHEPLLRHDSGNYLADLSVHQRLSTGDRNNRRIAFLHRSQALIHR
jgi:hypothetical protein